MAAPDRRYRSASISSLIRRTLFSTGNGSSGFGAPAMSTLIVNRLLPSPSGSIDWRPPGGMKFDFVRTGLEYVPRSRRRDFVAHLLDTSVHPDGRLIIGAFNEVRASLTKPPLEQLVASWGYHIAGRVERPHVDCRIAYRAFWIDNRGRSS